jgi:hypothetical protein
MIGPLRVAVLFALLLFAFAGVFARAFAFAFGFARAFAFAFAGLLALVFAPFAFRSRFDTAIVNLPLREARK